MKRGVALLALAVTLIATNVSAGIFSKVPTMSGNYCKDEVIEFFEERFPGAENVSLNTFGSGRSWAFWMSTNLCRGYFVFDFRGIEGFQCKMTQYGQRTRFMSRVWAYGDCKNLMPRDEYPR